MQFGTADTIPSFSECVDGVWEQYLCTRKVRPSTRSGYSSILKNHVLPVWGDWRLDRIRPRDVTVFLSGLSGRFESKFVSNVYALLLRIFGVAEANELIVSNPVRPPIHRPTTETKEKPALDSAEIRDVIDQSPLQWKPLLLTLALTGLRIGELLALQWRDLDMEGSPLIVRRSLWNGQLQPSTKTKKQSFRYVVPVLQAELRSLRETMRFAQDEDLIFCQPDGSPLDPNELRRTVLYPAMDRAGIERQSRTHGFHIFRHSAGSIIHKQTGSMKLAQVQLGHATMAMTSDVYVHTDHDQLERAGVALAGAIMPTELPTEMPTVLLPTEDEEVPSSITPTKKATFR